MLFEIQGVICDSRFILAVGPLREETASGRTHFIKMQDDVAMAAIDFDRICYETVYLTAEEAAPVMEYFKVYAKRDSMPMRLTKMIKALEREFSTLARLRVKAGKTHATKLDEMTDRIHTAIDNLNAVASEVRGLERRFR